MMNWNSKQILIVVFIVVVGLVLLFFIGRERNDENDLLLRNGRKSVGVVIDKGIIRSNIGETFSVKYRFETNTGHKIESSDHYYHKSEYRKAIVGKEYEVRYLPDDPRNHCKIYLDNPLR